jgi:integrase/recombinase XerC
VLHATGCRPGEARGLTAADLDTARGIWRKPGKTTRRTGRDRVVHLPPALAVRLAELARANPAGPILRNTEGNPWTQTAVNTQMRRLRARIGAGKELVSYGFRHLFATDALENGVEAATVATLLGHSSLKMLMERYSHLIERDGHLKDALGKIRGDGDDSPDESRPGGKQG